MRYPLVRELAAAGFPVRLTCGVLGVSTQAFYKWRARPCSPRDLDDAYVLDDIIDLHAQDPTFGYRFIADELRAAGERIGERRVWRLCSLQRIYSTATKTGRKTSPKTPGPAVHDDLVGRDFTAPAPNRVWLTDITEHPTGEGKLYVCCVKDVFSNRIVGWAISERMTRHLAIAALRQAVTRRRPSEVVVVHSDRGGQFRARDFLAVLRAHHLAGSMGRVAAAGDNAAMESFYALLQKNVLDQRRWASRDQLASAIVIWIERDYNNRRRQRRLGKLTPVEFELAFTQRDRQNDRAA